MTERRAQFSITLAQKKCLEFLETFLAERGRTPGYREIAEGMNIWPGHAHGLVKQLEMRGRIQIMRRGNPQSRMEIKFLPQSAPQDQSQDFWTLVIFPDGSRVVRYP